MLDLKMPRRLPPGCIEDVDKKYNVIRIYYRPKKGMKKIRLRGTPWTPEFMEAYAAAMGGSNRPKQTRAKPGTWGHLCAMCQEPIKPGSDRTFNDFPLSKMSPHDIEVLRDRKIHTPEAANGRLKAARQVCKFGAKNQKYLKINIARDVEYFHTGSTGFHTWTIEEVQQFEARHPIGTKARLAFALLLFTGQRRSDVIRFGRQHMRNGLLTFTQFKGRKKKPKRLILPVLPVLREIIDASPCGELTFLINDLGRAFSDAGIGNKMRDWCDQAGLPHCTAHGVRKAGATIAAENGATGKQLMAIFGWDSMKQAELYTRAADQKRMAADAMHLIEVGPVS
jgi:integrase